ncbi:MAG: hypothetical protein ACXWC4_08090 [Telluria sp.]
MSEAKTWLAPNRLIIMHHCMRAALDEPAHYQWPHTISPQQQYPYLAATNEDAAHDTNQLMGPAHTATLMQQAIPFPLHRAPDVANLSTTLPAHVHLTALTKKVDKRQLAFGDHSQNETSLTPHTTICLSTKTNLPPI